MSKVASLLVTFALAMTVVIAGCSGTPDKNVARKDAKAKPKTVVVNEGLSKKKEEKLNKRLDELENKVESQDLKEPKGTEKGPQDTSSQSTESAQSDQPQASQAEAQAQAAAEAYYAAVAARNWGYTYDHLDSETQSAYSEQEWFAKNDYLADAGSVTYTIESVDMDSAYPKTVADVTVILTAADGSTSVRNTFFVYEDGSWLHRFSSEEYDLFASAPTATSFASSSASASASASASPTASSSPSASPSPSPKPSPNRNDNSQGNGHRRAGHGGTKPNAPRGGGGIDCGDVNGPIRVSPSDPNNLDGDGDGIGCEQE